MHVTPASFLAAAWARDWTDRGLALVNAFVGLLALQGLASAHYRVNLDRLLLLQGFDERLHLVGGYDRLQLTHYLLLLALQSVDHFLMLLDKGVLGHHAGMDGLFHRNQPLELQLLLGQLLDFLRGGAIILINHPLGLLAIRPEWAHHLRQVVDIIA